jgi:hypothetical protein
MNKDFLTKKKKSIFQIIKIQKKQNLGNKLVITSDLNDNNQNNSFNESLSVLDIEKKDTTKNSLISISREVFKFIKHKRNTKGSDVTNHILEVLSKKGSNLNYKNIQRRVYDAINVMCAIGLISKEKVNINFLGSKECEDNCLSTNNSSKVRSNDSIYPDDQNESDKEIKDIQNTINEQKNELIKLFTERYFYDKIVNLNQNDFKKSGCIDKLEFPFYLVTVDKKNELKVKQNDLNTKVVIYSKSDIKLYKPYDIIKILCENDFTKENLIDRIKNFYREEKVFDDFFKQKNLFVDNDVDLLNCIKRFIEQKIISFLVKLFFILESTNYINSYVNIKDKNTELFERIDDLYNKNKEMKFKNRIITINKPDKYNLNKSREFFNSLITEIQLNLDKLDDNEKLAFEIILYNNKESEEREIEEKYIDNWKNFLDEINSNFFKEYENDIQFKEIFDCNEDIESFNLLLEDLIKFLNLKIKLKKEFSIGVMKTIVEKLLKNLELFKIINLSNLYKIIYVISYVFYNENFIKNIYNKIKFKIINKIKMKYLN